MVKKIVKISLVFSTLFQETVAINIRQKNFGSGGLIAVWGQEVKVIMSHNNSWNMIFCHSFVKKKITGECHQKVHEVL